MLKYPVLSLQVYFQVVEALAVLEVRVAAVALTPVELAVGMMFLWMEGFQYYLLLALDMALSGQGIKATPQLFKLIYKENYNSL